MQRQYPGSFVSALPATGGTHSHAAGLAASQLALGGAKTSFRVPTHATLSVLVVVVGHSPLERMPGYRAPGRARESQLPISPRAGPIAELYGAREQHAAARFVCRDCRPGSSSVMPEGANRCVRLARCSAELDGLEELCGDLYL